MSIVNVHKAKTHLSRLLVQAENGEQVIIARNGKPVARLAPVGRRGTPRFGSWKDRISIDDSFFDPLPEEELAYDRAIEQLAQGQNEMIPSAFADRILDGESAVRVWREYRKLSVKDLADLANISASYLSQIEGGSRDGSLPTLKALAQALELDLSDLT